MCNCLDVTQIWYDGCSIGYNVDFVLKLCNCYRPIFDVVTRRLVYNVGYIQNKNKQEAVIHQIHLVIQNMVFG